ncbi:glycoside hydrolase family 3 protein [Shivajiella indica]|uniref:beta-N-acetylhexosaminidase n=1 Tax=Shivajiella indica TaxID=872115 RepID=A0ABW5BEE0_9BACT
MNLKEKIGQFFFPAAFIHDSEENIAVLEQIIRQHHIGGLTFFHSRHAAAANFENRQENLDYHDTLQKLLGLIERYQKASRTPLLISIDAEYGLAMRIENTPQYPYAITLGAIPESQKDLIWEVGYRIGKDLKQCGIHINFAPVADINSNPNNPVIGYRSFGTDKMKVSRFAMAMYKGMETAGVSACYKHFPGHGDTDIDSHLGLPIIHKSKKELMELELFPYIEGIKSGLKMIMVGHLAAPALSSGKNIPASISKEIITDLLIDELGFDGIVVSDALNMKSVSDLFREPGKLELEAFNAGVDILCFSENVSEGIQMIADEGKEKRINRSFEKIMDLKNRLGLMDRKTVKNVYFDWDDHHAFNEKLASHYISVLVDNDTESDIIDSRSFAKVSVFSPLFNPFFGELDNHQSTPSFEINSVKDLAWKDLQQFENLLIALYVPSAKPINHFGLDMEVMKKLAELTMNKKCQLYLFGNPLAIKELPNKRKVCKIICAYQNFENVQKTAALHFLDELDTEIRFDM